MSGLNNRAKGRNGELLAEEYLAINGYDIIERNYRNRFGEIDLIAREGNTLVFIEVKTRNNYKHGLPADAVDERKQRRLGRVALSYIANEGINNQSCRFDVLSIIENRVELLKDAFILPEGSIW